MADALVLDCESRITADQTLTFGFWQFCQLRDENYVGLEEGIFHDDELGAKELGVLRKYAKVTKPETAVRWLRMVASLFSLQVYR